MTTPYHELLRFKQEFEELKINLANIRLLRSVFDPLKTSLVNWSKQQAEGYLEMPNEYSKSISQNIKNRFNIGSAEPTGIWIDKFISKYVDLESYLFQCYILDPSEKILYRKPSKFISSALEAQKFDTMIDRILKGISKILAYGNRIVLKRDYNEKKKQRDRLKREEKRKEEEKKLHEKKSFIIDLIVRYKTTYALLFLELVIIVLSVLFTDIMWVRILLFTLIPVFLVMAIVGYILESKNKK